MKKESREDTLHVLDDETRKRFKTWQYRTLAATIIGYALFYIVRKNFSLAMPGLQAEMGLSKASLGIFLTAHSLVYGFSRFVLGFVADRWSARKLMPLGLLLCALVNLAFGFAPQMATMVSGENAGTAFLSSMVLVMGILWVLNGCVQGAGFPPCARLITHWVPPNELASKMAIWNTSHSIGAALITILCGYIMGNSILKGMPNPDVIPGDIWANLQSGFGFGYGSWRWCFWVPSGIAFLGAGMLWFVLRDTPTSVGLPELPGTGKAKIDSSDAPTWAFLRKHVFGNPVIWILGFANLFVYIVRLSVLDWGPTFLSQSKGVSLVHAGWLVAMFEICGILGMVSFGFLTDYVLHGRVPRAAVLGMLGTVICFSFFWMLPGTAPVWMLLIALGGSGFFIYGPHALIGVAVANQATKKAAATANGFTGLFGYASTLFSGVGVGVMADRVGWDWIYAGIIGVAMVGMLTFLMLWNLKPSAYEKMNEFDKTT